MWSKHCGFYCVEGRKRNVIQWWLRDEHVNIYQKPDVSYLGSANPKGPMSHLSLSPYTGSRLQLASSSRHWCLHVEQPQAQHPPTSTPLWQSISPQEVWDLRASDTLWCHPREAQNHFPECFRSLFLAGGMNFPPLSGMLNPRQFSSDTWKLISSDITRLHLKKKQPSLSFFNFALSLSD